MVDLVTIGYLTLDDLVLGDDRVLRDTLGGGALFSAVGALAWAARSAFTPAAGATTQMRIWSRSEMVGSTWTGSLPDRHTACVSGCSKRGSCASSNSPS